MHPCCFSNNWALHCHCKAVDNMRHDNEKQQLVAALLLLLAALSLSIAALSLHIAAQHAP
jgi:hypothetical protein